MTRGNKQWHHKQRENSRIHVGSKLHLQSQQILSGVDSRRAASNGSTSRGFWLFFPYNGEYYQSFVVVTIRLNPLQCACGILSMFSSVLTRMCSIERANASRCYLLILRLSLLFKNDLLHHQYSYLLKAEDNFLTSECLNRALFIRLWWNLWLLFSQVTTTMKRTHVVNIANSLMVLNGF